MKINTLYFVIASLVSSLHGAQYSVIIDSIPKPVTIVVPSGFTPAKTAEHRQIRDAILSFYKDAPNARGIYSSAFLLDWDGEISLPYIVVGTLGSTRTMQGKVTQAWWDGFRQKSLNYSEEEIKKVRQKRLEQEKKGINEQFTLDELNWMENTGDENSAVIYGLMKVATQDGGEAEIASARKVIYHKGHVVALNFAIDARTQDAFLRLREYVRATIVSGIEGQ